MLSTSGSDCSSGSEDDSNFSSASSSRSLKRRHKVSEPNKSRMRTVAARYRRPVPCRLPRRETCFTTLGFRRSLSRTISSVSRYVPSTATLNRGVNDGPNDSSNGEIRLGGCSAAAQSTPLKNPTSFSHCGVCRLTDYQDDYGNNRNHWSWTPFEIFETSATTGCQCCNIIVDAISMWFARKTINADTNKRLSLATAEVNLHVYPSSQTDLEDPSALCPMIHLRWRTSDDEIDSHTTPSIVPQSSLFVFQPLDSIAHASDIAAQLSFARRPLPCGDTASPQTFARLRGWINTCVHCHKTCNLNVDVIYFPKRVLEITPTKVILRENLNVNERYACLSHCWGPNGLVLKLTRATLGTLKSGYVHSLLPKTFRDAVRICMQLDIYYIWIDALCIVQDDLHDWTATAADMANVYENAFLTIAATGSVDSNGGCFLDPDSPLRRMKLKSSILHVAEWNEQRDYNSRIGSTNYSNPGAWPLLQRAWVYQERTLSARFIHFTHDQLLWECHCMLRSEHGDLDEDWTQGKYEGRSGDTVPFKYEFVDSRDAWHQVVSTYSALQLTYPKDRLPALAAIVQREMRNRGDDIYVAGLWENTLLADLKWLSSPHESLKHARPLSDTPSWSWASVKGAIHYSLSESKARQYNDSSLDDLISRCKAKVTFAKVGPPQLGSVTNATISLESRSYMGSLRYSHNPFDDMSERYLFEIQPLEGDSETMPLIQPWILNPDYDLFTGSSPIQNKEEIHVVMVGLKSHRFGFDCGIKVRGFALRKLSDGVFQRIGWCEFRIIRTKPNVCREAKLRDNLEWRYARQLLVSLPVRTFKIV